MKRHSAFSLIELSIVILIIGILVAGITQSSRLVKKFKIRTAQNVTHSSPIHSIKDLMLWYETSLDTSFDASETEDSTAITNWYDNNKQSSYKNNATSSGSARPLYIEDGINSLPTVRFDGSNDLMNFDGSGLVATGYTIFVVEQRRANSINNYFIAGTDGTVNSNLVLGYRNNTTITQAHHSNDMDFTVNGYSQPTAVINTFYFSTNSGKKYWLNGGVSADASDVAQTQSLSSYNGASLGKYTPTPSFFNGDISEVIIFNRSLKTEERQSVESYLSKKYNITIS